MLVSFKCIDKTSQRLCIRSQTGFWTLSCLLKLQAIPLRDSLVPNRKQAASSWDGMWYSGWRISTVLAWLGLRGCCVRKRARGLWKLGELHWGTGHEGKWCPGSKDAEGKDGVSLKTDSPSVHSFSQQSPGYRTFQLQKPLFAPGKNFISSQFWASMRRALQASCTQLLHPQVSEWCFLGGYGLWAPSARTAHRHHMQTSGQLGGHQTCWQPALGHALQGQGGDRCWSVGFTVQQGICWSHTKKCGNLTNPMPVSGCCGHYCFYAAVRG